MTPDWLLATGAVPWYYNTKSLINCELPDTYFENAAKTFVQQETQTVVLFGDGLVVYSQR